MSKSVRALLYNFLGFAPFFLLVWYLVGNFTNLTGFWVPATAAIASTILAPKFQAIKHMGEEKIFMKWLFLRGVKIVG